MVQRTNDFQSSIDEAFSCFRNGQWAQTLSVIESLPGNFGDDPALLRIGGLCCFYLGRLADAATFWTRLEQAQPHNDDNLGNLALALRGSGRLDDAEAALRRALAINPASASAYTNLGVVLHDQGRSHEAEAALRQALSLNPDFVAASDTLGLVLRKTNRPAEAAAAFRHALTIDPKMLNARINLGLCLHETRHLAEAEDALRSALAIDPAYADVHLYLARVLHDAGRLDEAEDAARRASALDPASAQALLVLGGVLRAKNAGDISSAIEAYRRALELDPNDIGTHANLAYSLLFQTDDGYEVLEECKRFADYFEAPFLTQRTSYANDRTPGRRLRIGYVSPDFRNHCQALFTTPLLRHHCHESFEIVCYSSVRKPDAVTAELSSFADIWRDVQSLDDEQLARQIVDDRIDILVDLTMHMCDARPLVFARRPAPVQVSWLAYPGTTGSKAIGYRFTDPWLDPDPAADDRYSERSIRLPDTFWCYTPLVTLTSTDTLPADDNGHITFACLNNPGKLTRPTLALWAKVLDSVSGSRMILLASKGHARRELSAIFEALGIDLARIEFVDYRPRGEYLQTYRRIDIALDTFPYNGHTTSLDGLWMGVPVVTRVGHSPASRAGFSILTNLGLQDLAALSDDQFIDAAVRLSRDLPYLRRLRANLRQMMEASPLMDGARFAQGVENAYRSMWVEWCARALPAS